MVSFRLAALIRTCRQLSHDFRVLGRRV